MKLKLLLLGSFLVFSSRIFSQGFHPVSNISGWESVASEHFDVNYIQGQEFFAIQVAKFAELARFELSELYDYKPELRYTIVFAANPYQLMRTNFVLPIDADQSGIFYLPRYLQTVVHPGTTSDLYHEVKKRVSQLMLGEFTSGRRLNNVVQTHILLSKPLWFWQGLSEYAGEGWTAKDEMILSSLRNEDVLGYALEGEGAMNRTVRKSIWRYIAHEYGEEKISEIIYLVNVSNSIEAGIISVLGIQLGTFTERWREFVRDLADANFSNRLSFQDLSAVKTLALKSGYDPISVAFHEASQQLAMYIQEKEKLQLMVYNLETDRLEVTKVAMTISDMPGMADFTYAHPVSWSPDGKKIATTLYNNGNYEFIIYDLENKSVESMDINIPVLWIHEIKWSHNGDKLALSALHVGGVDIFITSPESGSFDLVTDDENDNIQPSWSLDDDELFFTSAEVLDGREFLPTTDLYRISLSGNGKALRLTQTPAINESQVQPMSTTELGFLTDESGILNFGELNLSTSKVRHVSNFKQGIYQWAYGEEKIVVSSFFEGKKQIYLLPSTVLSPLDKVEKTLLREEYENAYNRYVKATSVLPNVKETEKPAEVVDRPSNQPDKQEEEKKKKKRYYIFDEGEEYELANPGEIVINKTLPGLPPKKQRPQLSEIEVKNPTSLTRTWATDRLGLNLVYDPIAKFGVDLRAVITDHLKNHQLTVQVTPYLNLKNWEAFSRYEFLKYRLDAYAEIGGWSRSFRQEKLSQDSIIFRFNQIYAKVGARYPITNHMAAEAEIGFYQINRLDQNLRRSDLLDDEDQLLRARLGFRFDNTASSQGYTYKGSSVYLGLDNFYSLTANRPVQNVAQFQLRNYLDLKGRIVLATQLTGGFSLFSNERAYYLGGVGNQFMALSFEKDKTFSIENNPISTQLYQFAFQEFISPVRAFWFNSRVGNKYVLANVELRLPFNKLLSSSLNSGSLYGIELIPFVDVGTAWSDGNPFSQRNPTDSRIISSSPVTVLLQTLKSPFLISLGSGLRTMLVGYSIRMDIAWGIDDNTVQKPLFNASLGKNF